MSESLIQKLNARHFAEDFASFKYLLAYLKCFKLSFFLIFGFLSEIIFKSNGFLFNEFLFPFRNWEWVIIQLIQNSLTSIPQGYFSSPKDYIRLKQKEVECLMADLCSWNKIKQKCSFSHSVLSYSRQIHEQFPLCFPAPHCQHEGPSQPSSRWEPPFWCLNTERLKVNILQHFPCTNKK